MAKYKVGDRVWLAHAGIEEITKTCPVCAGTQNVTLILGNGDRCELPCDYCARGYDGPTGRKHEYEYTVGAEELTITQVDISETAGMEEIHYHCDTGRYATPDDVFDTKEEALAQCERWREEKRIEEATRAEFIKKDQAKSYAWNAGYHLREAKREEESAARHREKARICKAKAGEDKA